MDPAAVEILIHNKEVAVRCDNGKRTLDGAGVVLRRDRDRRTVGPALVGRAGAKNEAAAGPRKIRPTYIDVALKGRTRAGVDGQVRFVLKVDSRTGGRAGIDD